MLQVSKKLLPRSKGEWPSGLRLCNKNRKVPGSKLARCLAGLRDPTSLQGSRWPSGRMWTKAVINIGLVRLSPWEWPKVGPGAAKWQFKKKKVQHPIHFDNHYLLAITSTSLMQCTSDGHCSMLHVPFHFVLFFLFENRVPKCYKKAANLFLNSLQKFWRFTVLSISKWAYINPDKSGHAFAE